MTVYVVQLAEILRNLQFELRSLFAKLGLAWVAPPDRELGK